jgi:hypothetical protein
MLVKLGGKVIVLAKSQQFCSAIDTITDPEQIKLLTLGAGAAESGEDFGAILKEIQPKSAQAKGSQEKRGTQTFEDKPSEAQIKSELDRLKRELGHMGARS